MRIRIVFKLLAMLALFGVALVLPLWLTAYRILSQEGAVGEKVLERFYQEMPGILFYAFFIGLVISLAFGKRILQPLRLLKEAAIKVKEGDFSLRLQRVSEDEIGEVMEVFNEMIDSLRDKTEELSKKELYINTMQDALWVVDSHDRVVDVNPAFTRIFGYTREEVLGTSVYDFFDREGKSIVAQEIAQKKSKGLVSSYKTYIYAKDGRKVPVMITGSPILSGGEVVGKIGVIKDISEIDSLMQEIEASRSHLRAIMESLEDALIMVDRDYRIIQANRVARDRYGEEIVGRRCYEVLHLETAPCFLKGEECPVHIVFSEFTSHRTVHRHLTFDGKIVFEDSHSSPVRDKTGQIIAVLQMLRDITERVQREGELKKRNAELELLNRLSSLLSSSLRAEEVLKKVLQQLIETFEMDGGGVFLFEEKSRFLNCAYHIGVSEEFVRVAGRVKLGEDIPGRVALTGEVITTSDVSADQRITRSILKHSGIKGYCCIPIKGKEKIIGVYCLFKYTEHVFGPDDERLLESIGEMTGLALENIRLYEQMKGLFEGQRQRRLKEQEILLKLSSALSTAIDEPEVIEITLQTAIEYLMADGAVFWELRPSRALVMRLCKGITLKERHQKSDIYSPEMVVLRDRNVILFGDIEGEPHDYYIDEELRSRGVRTMLCCPVMVGEKVLGVVTFVSFTKRRYPEEDIHFVRILLSIFAVAYERTHYYKRSLADRGLAESILNAITEGVCTVDREGKVLTVNNAITQILGLPPDYIVGRHYRDILKNFAYSCPVEEALKGDVSTGEMIIEDNGRERVIQVTSVPLKDKNGLVYAAVQVLRDITREREIDRLKTEIVRSVSHEFRTPLSAIVGMTEMLLDGDVTGDRAKDYLRIMYEEGLRLSEMVSQLLDISRLEGGLIEPILEKVRMDEVVETLKNRFSERFRQKRIEFRCSIGEGTEEFITDREMLLQILTNLIDNSSKYSDDGAVIELETKVSDNYVIIKVVDTGWGIPSEDLSHLGKRFFRGVHGQKTKGTGLGLTLCREILKRLEGKMEIQSKIGEGTSVSVYLPLQGAGYAEKGDGN